MIARYQGLSNFSDSLPFAGMGRTGRLMIYFSAFDAVLPTGELPAASTNLRFNRGRQRACPRSRPPEFSLFINVRSAREISTLKSHFFSMSAGRQISTPKFSLFLNVLPAAKSQPQNSHFLSMACRPPILNLKFSLFINVLPAAKSQPAGSSLFINVSGRISFCQQSKAGVAIWD